MSEPMGNCHLAGSNGLPSFGSHHLHELSSGCGLQMGCLEPVSEEARFRASSNMDNLNMLVGSNGDEENEYYLKTNTINYAGSFKGESTSGYPTSRLDDMGDMYQSADGSGHVYHTYTQPHDRVLATTSIINNSSNIGNNLSTSKTSGDCSQERSNNHTSRKKNDASRQSCAKGARRFHFIGAFIPSFVFVVIAMTVTAIVILESDCQILSRIRNMPEMINLRYQYYQPLKDYLIQKFTRNSFNNHYNH